jgi:hypothetical protein
MIVIKGKVSTGTWSSKKRSFSWSSKTSQGVNVGTLQLVFHQSRHKMAASFCVVSRKITRRENQSPGKNFAKNNNIAQR